MFWNNLWNNFGSFLVYAAYDAVFSKSCFLFSPEMKDSQALVHAKETLHQSHILAQN